MGDPPHAHLNAHLQFYQNVIKNKFGNCKKNYLSKKINKYCQLITNLIYNIKRIQAYTITNEMTLLYAR